MVSGGRLVETKQLAVLESETSYRLGNLGFEEQVAKVRIVLRKIEPTQVQDLSDVPRQQASVPAIVGVVAHVHFLNYRVKMREIGAEFGVGEGLARPPL